MNALETSPAAELSNCSADSSKISRAAILGGALASAAFGSAAAVAAEAPAPPAAVREVPAEELPANTQPVQSEAVEVRQEGAQELDALFQNAAAQKIETGTLQILGKDGKVLRTAEIPLSEDPEQNKALLWLGIAACLAGSAALSGMNAGVMSLNRLKLEVLAEKGNRDAQRLLKLRQDSNTVLSTILWGNVGVNCLLTLLADSALTGVAGFAFSVGGLTLMGEILPQGYFSRNALWAGARMAPVIQGLKYALYPVTKPTGMLLDALVGKEGREFYAEKELGEVLEYHIRHPGSEISAVEARGAKNFLALDDIPIGDKGEAVNEKSIITLPAKNGVLEIPDFKNNENDPFLKKIQESGERWVVFCNEQGEPQYLLDADSFIRDSFFAKDKPELRDHWHRPIIVRDKSKSLGSALEKLTAQDPEDDVIDQDVILLWDDEAKRIITGADVLGRLLRGVVASVRAEAGKAESLDG